MPFTVSSCLYKTPLGCGHPLSIKSNVCCTLIIDYYLRNYRTYICTYVCTCMYASYISVRCIHTKRRAINMEPWRLVQYVFLSVVCACMYGTARMCSMTLLQGSFLYATRFDRRNFHFSTLYQDCIQLAHNSVHTRVLGNAKGRQKSLGC